MEDIILAIGIKSIILAKNISDNILSSSRLCGPI